MIVEGSDTSTGAQILTIATPVDYADSAYAEFTSGTQENEFKADVSALALQSEVANLNGWAPILDGDSLIIDMTSLSARPVIGDTSQGVDEVYAEVQNLNAWTPLLDNESLIVDISTLANRAAIGDTNDAGDVTITDTDMGILADSVWSRDTSDNNTAGKMGKQMAIAGDSSLWATVDGVADAVWDEDSTGHNVTNSFGEISEGWDGGSSLTLSDIAAAVWNIAYNTAFTAGSMGDSMNNASLGVILDSLQEFDDWVAHQSTVDSIIDSLLTEASHIGIDWNDIANKTANVDLTATTIFATDIATAVGGVSANGITASSIASNAIDADALATDAIDEIMQYDTSLIASGIGKTITETYFDHRDSTMEVLSVAKRSTFKATGFSSHSAADVWTSGTRTLTAFEEGSMTIDIDGTTIGTATSVTNDVNIADVDMGNLADSVWNIDFATAFEPSSMGDSLSDVGYVQGAASLTAKQVATAVWSDTLTNYSEVGTFGEDADSWDGGSSLTLADIADAVWDEDSSLHGAAGSMGLLQASAEGSDTAAIFKMLIDEKFARVTVDTPIIITAGSGGGGRVALDDTTLGDVSYIANNPNVYKATGFATHTAADVYTEFTTGGNADAFKATGFSTHDPVATYAEFVSGTNENAFKATSGSNAEAFKADVSALSTFDETTDSVIVGYKSILAEHVADSVLKDSLSFQGEAATLTTAGIKAAVWGDTQNVYTTVGTFGYYLDQQVSAVTAPSGPGPYTYYVVVIDSTNGADTVLQAVEVAINNQAQSASPWTATTDENGIATFGMNVGDFVIVAGPHGFAAITDSVAISGSATDTVWTYQLETDGTAIAFDFQSPTGAHYANAILMIDLVSVNDSLLYAGDTIVGWADSWSVVDTADNVGVLTVNLHPNARYTNDSTYYKIKVFDQSEDDLILRTQRFRVPDTSAVMNFHELTRWPN
jgi:hypothetical protein